MKALKIICSLLIACFVVSCSKDYPPEFEPIGPRTYINGNQSFKYKNSSGEDLFEKGVYKAEQLSLIATDENWEPLLKENGEIYADVEGRAEISYYHAPVLELLLGHLSFIDDENNLAIGYFKLKYDENKYDKIEVHNYYNVRDGKYLYITKVIYNGVEYPASEMPIVIQKEE